MTFERELIVPTSLADEIAFRLEAAILDGTYAPGTHLLQDELCERFGVSRTPVREALRKLQAQHLVEVVPNRGAKVRAPTRGELIDVYAVRAELEGLACELAARAVTAETIAALDAAQTVIEAAVTRFEAGAVGPAEEASFNVAMTRANEEFHGVIHRAGGNDRLRLIVEDLQSFFPKDYVWRAITTSADLDALNIEEHRRIRDALAARAGKRARREMEAHIRHASKLLLVYLDEHGFWATSPG